MADVSAPPAAQASAAQALLDRGRLALAMADDGAIGPDGVYVHHLGALGEHLAANLPRVEPGDASCAQQ